MNHIINGTHEPDFVTISMLVPIHLSRNLRKLGSFVQLLSFEVSIAMPRVPVPAGFFPVST